MAYTELPYLARIAKKVGQHIREMRPAIAEQAERLQSGGSLNPGEEQLVEWKEDQSPVTKADLAAHHIIEQELVAWGSTSALLSEEGTKEEIAQALKSNDRIETDPLDNTGTYISNKPGRDGYSVNLGRVVDGLPVEGAIYFPEKSGGKGELYYTDKGKAWLQIGDDKPQEISVRKGAILRKPLQVAVGYNEQKLDYLAGLETQSTKDAGQYRTCLVASGKCDVTGLNEGANGGFNTYDIAGPHAVLLAAGGDIISHDPAQPGEGKPFRYDNGIKVPSHVVGSNDALMALKLTTKAALAAGKSRV